MENETKQSQKKLTFPMEMVRWWERKRLLFNAIVVLITSLTIWSLWQYTGPLASKTELIHHAFWLIVWCNVMYTSGWAGGILRRYYIKGQTFSNTGRWLLFIAGTIFTAFIIEIRLSILVNPMFLG
jgi:hypothetical protein